MMAKVNVGKYAAMPNNLVFLSIEVFRTKREAVVFLSEDELICCYQSILTVTSQCQ